MTKYLILLKKLVTLSSGILSEKIKILFILSGISLHFAADVSESVYPDTQIVNETVTETIISPCPVSPPCPVVTETKTDTVYKTKIKYVECPANIIYQDSNLFARFTFGKGVAVLDSIGLKDKIIPKSKRIKDTDTSTYLIIKNKNPNVHLDSDTIKEFNNLKIKVR